MCHQPNFSLIEIVNVIIASIERSVTNIDAAPCFASAVAFATVVVIVADVPQINY